MRKLPIIPIILLLLLVSCQKDDPDMNVRLPDWLEDRIQADEAYVAQNPKSMLSIGVWVRTVYDNNLYFEYHNMLSSSLFAPISYKGDTLNVYVRNSSSDYFQKKCCSEIVWYGSGIDEENLEMFYNHWR